jgi:acyl-CoA synthetase (AMP-forming)/AMP-acid ligase II
MLVELLRARAGATPDETAFVVADGGTLSYATWERRSDAAAAGLRSRGVGPGDRVVLAFDVADFVELAVAAAAVRKLGAVMVPLADHGSVVEQDRVARH